MNEKSIICRMLIQGTFLLFFSIQTIEAQPIPPLAEGGKDIVTYINKPTKFEGLGNSSEDYVICEWDFDGDGTFDTLIGGREIVYYQYNTTGSYEAVFKVTSVSNISSFDIVNVTVKEGTGAQEYYTESVSVSKTDVKKQSDTSLSKADGIVDRYAVMINGGSESRFWDDVEFTYNILKNKYNFSDEFIYLLNNDGVDPYGANPGNMIDYEAKWSNVDAVFSLLASTMDQDDELFIWITDHGSGYYGEESEYHGYLRSRADIDPDDEQDYLESDFKLRSLCTFGNYYCNHGLDVWKVKFTTSEYYRNKFVSHFTDVYFEDYATTVSDNDVRIERFIDYLAGDFNRNGKIDYDLGEVYDFDGDGNFPYIPGTNTFDEDDWGNIDKYVDNFNDINSSTPYNRYYLIFDDGLDGTLDIDLRYDPNNLQVDGTDIDNLGLFDGVDINEDGDMDDYVSIDEFVMLKSGMIYDDDLSIWTKSLNANKISVVMQPCFSGGFIEDLSNNNLVIATATTEENVAYMNVFIREFMAALGWENFNGYVVDADYDNNGYVSMMEAYEYARTHDYLEEITQYDDNGDGIPHEGPLPQAGDGFFGAGTYLQACNQPPYVYAGEDTILIFEHSLQLSGVVEDDGLPADMKGSFYWSTVSGPGSVIFLDSLDLNTFVSFSDTGTYIVRLYATDGQLSTSDDITIRVSLIITKQPVSQLICEKDSVSFNLCLKTKLPLSYQWFFNNDQLTDNANITGSTTSILHIKAVAIEDEGYYDCQLTYNKSQNSYRAELKIIIPPSPPIVKDTASCEGEYLNFLYAEGNNITWYSDSELTNPISDYICINVSNLTDPGQYIFYVTQTDNNSCESVADSILYTINPIPPPPLVIDQEFCEDETDPILIAKGENIFWYQDFSGILIDSRDGQQYKGIRIGDQVWMAENLNYYVPQRSSYYDDDSVSYASVYGRLYNYPDYHLCPNVCPSGWHVPSLAEWQILIDYLGGDSVAGGSLKEGSFDHWEYPNEGATNASLFNALPGGYFNGSEYTGILEKAHLWTSQTGMECGWAKILSYDSEEVLRICKYYYDTKASVRCIKDNLNQFFDDGDTLLVPHNEEGMYCYYATQTILNCESPFDTVLVTINPIPTAPESYDTTVCGLDNIPELTAKGENIRWYSDAGLTNLLHSGKVFYEEHTETGKYTYFVTQTMTNCEGPADTIFLTVYSVPKVDLGPDTTINDFQDITIGLSEDENHSYLWNNGSDEASITISGQEAGVGDHSYCLIVTDSNSCENSDTVVIHVEHFIAVPYTYENRSIKIYPNPTGEFLNISFEDIIDKEILIRVYNISGKEMIHKTYEPFSEKNILELDISYLPSGIYYIGIIGEKIKFSGSFTKK